jgi:hypothetical protein
MIIETEVGKNNSKQRSVLKGTSSKEHSEADSAPPAQKIRVEKNASSVLALNAPVPVTDPVLDLHPASAVAAAATVKAGAGGTGGAAGAGGKVVELVKRSHQKGAGALHKKLLAAAQAAIPALSDPLLTSSTSSSSSSSSSSLLLPVSSLTGTASVPSVCSRVALASILKSDPLTSITYQTFSGTNSCTCKPVERCYKEDLLNVGEDEG